MNLYFFKYNNYYNRKTPTVVPDYVSDYNGLSTGNHEVIKNVLNWNPNDGINTRTVTLTMNNNDIADYNYMVTTEDDVHVDSRWFVAEATYVRAGQYQFTLKRDVIADSPSWKFAPSYIEKGYVKSISDPAIYNREQLDLNQIKTGEKLIKDKTGCPWIVGYLAKGHTFGTINEEKKATLTFTDYGTPPDINSTQTMEAWLATYHSKILSFRESATNYRFTGKDTNGRYFYQYWDSAKNSINYIETWDKAYAQGNVPVNVLMNSASIAYKALVNGTTFAQFEDIDGKTIQFNDTVNTSKYRIHAKTKFVPTGFMSNSESDTPKGVDISGVDTYYKGIIGHYAYLMGEGILTVVATDILTYDITLEDVGKGSTTYTLTSDLNKKIRTKDAPFDMFAIPYSDGITFKRNSDTISITPTMSLSMLTATEIAEDTSKIYDVQIVPYCPIQNLTVNSDGSISTNGTVNQDYDIVTTGPDNKEVNIVFYAEYSSFKFSISENIQVSTDPMTFKLDNQCKKYRVCAPNYSSAFEISAGDNQGISQWNISCTYLPYSPYIHIYPNWGGLYGSKLTDQRGLIYTGNMSISTTSDAWKNYVTQNSNYQNIFDREVQNLTFTQDIQRKQALTNVFLSPITGGATGAGAGSQFGQAGAIAGAGIGAGLNTAGAIIDYNILKSTQAEALDYKKDMYNMSLANIKALPNTLSKVTAFNIDNKYFPFIEYYDCTPQEREALKNKMIYNGMTINRIGKPIDFIESGYYIKCIPIRLNIEGDSHFLTELSNELNKGAFISDELSVNVG